MPHSSPFVATADQTRTLETEAVDRGVSWAELMERAGRGIADQIVDRYGPLRDKRVLVLVGPGNNGGDGLVVARHLHDAGAKLALYIWKRAARPDDQPWRECRNRNIPELAAQNDDDQARLQQIAARADLVIDALLGIGVTRALDGTVAAIVRTINAVKRDRTGSSPQIVSVDVPSGINADTGAIMGNAIEADWTIATGIIKRGHVLSPGISYTGALTCVPIGLDLDKETAMAESLSAGTLRPLLPARPADSHKGTFGKVMVVAGAGRYPGAAYLAASGALRSGAGLVNLGCGRSIFGALASALHEVTFLPLPEEDWGVLGADAAKEIHENLEGFGALVLGPGLGREDATKTFLERVLKLDTPKSLSGVGFLHVPAPAERPRKSATGGGVGFRRGGVAEAPADAPAEAATEPTETALPPLVIDADGLYLLAQIEEWWTKLPANSMILTPHPGEMARLLKLNDAAEVNADRVGAAQRAAQEWSQIVVLKGAETVIAAPDGKASIGPSGNPALATAGTGDVLAGIIGGLIAQGVDQFDAARLGVWLHAQAGAIVRREVGEAGAIAGDLLARLPQAITELRG
jgi:ADP-dependent NAD(P)H-hydrate dehydratase / NAD(P)H-hydrate epimerase